MESALSDALTIAFASSLFVFLIAIYAIYRFSELASEMCALAVYTNECDEEECVDAQGGEYGFVSGEHDET